MEDVNAGQMMAGEAHCRGEVKSLFMIAACAVSDVRISIKICIIFFSIEFCFLTILTNFNLGGVGSHNQKEPFLHILRQILTLEAAQA